MIDAQNIAESLLRGQEFNTSTPPVPGCLPTGGTVSDSLRPHDGRPFSKEDIFDRNDDWYANEIDRIKALPPKEASKAIGEFTIPDGVRFTIGGLDAKITFTGATPYGGRRGKRGKIIGWSPRARKRYREFVRACPLLLDPTQRWLWIILTYEGKTLGPDTGIEAKSHLSSLFKRLTREGYRYYVWTQEWQGRGSIHFNLIIENLMAPARHEKQRKQILTMHRKWFASMWHEITGSDQYHHLLYGCKVYPIQSEDMVSTLMYIASYVGKEEQSIPPAWFKDVGRCWGHSRTLKSFRTHYELTAGAPRAGGPQVTPPRGDPAALSMVIRTLSKFHKSSRIEHNQKKALRVLGMHTPESLSAHKANGLIDPWMILNDYERRHKCLAWERPKKILNGLTLYGEKPGDDVVTLQKLRSIVNRLGWDIAAVSTDKAERRLSSIASQAPTGSLTRIIENATLAGIEIPPPCSKPLRPIRPSYLYPKWEQTTLELTVDRPPGTA